MRKYRFYIFVISTTVIVGILIYFISDYSQRVKLIYSLFKEEDKNKIIAKLVEKVDSDSLKRKLDISLRKFGKKIENNEYSDDQLKNLINDFEQISNLNKIDSSMVENFYQKVNRDF